MGVKDTTKQYIAINSAPAPLTVPNTVSRDLAVGDRSFVDVVFESGKPVLDCELNLQQDAQAFANALISKHAQQFFAARPATTPTTTSSSTRLRRPFQPTALASSGSKPSWRGSR